MQSKLFPPPSEEEPPKPSKGALYSGPLADYGNTSAHPLPKNAKLPWEKEPADRPTVTDGVAADQDGPPHPPPPDDQNEPALPPSDEPPSFQFTGTGEEFFRIWIVNICLTILTLGLYSAWATVRTRRYFYGHTSLAGSSFDYLATPQSILRGRVVVGILVLLYIIAITWLPAMELVFWGILAVALPWVVIRAMRFKTTNSAWRNIRFRFDAQYAEAWRVFVGNAILSALTIGLAFPYFVYRKQTFLLEHCQLGDSHFRVALGPRPYYRVYGIAVVAWAVALGLGILLALPTGQLVTASTVQSQSANWMDMISALLAVVVVTGTSFWVASFVQSQTTNLLWNHAAINEHRFSSRLEVLPLMRLNIVNAMAVLISFGLLIPWAKVRSTRYRIEQMRLLAVGSLDQFSGSNDTDHRAVGSELEQVMEIDLGL